MSVAIAMMLLAAGDPVLMPQEKWRLDVEEESCVLQRQFGAGSTQATLRIVPKVYSAQIALSLTPSPKLRRSVRIDSITVNSPRGVTEWRNAQTPTPGETIITKDGPPAFGQFDEGLLAALDAGGIITVSAEDGRRTALEVNNVAGARKALAGCMADLLPIAGITAEQRASIALGPQPQGNLADWFDERYYKPIDESGSFRSVLRARVNVNGHVDDCRIVTSSKVQKIDLLSCGLLLRFGQFMPAKNAGGQAVEGFFLLPVRVELLGG